MNELNFLDLVVLKKIDAESSVEKFGSIINTSFFETANLLGTMKIKGYVNIESSVGGVSRVIMTDAGASILSVAKQKADEPIEPLDNAILHAVAAGTKETGALKDALNVRSGDLAFHVNKLVAQGFLDYEVRSAKVSLVLSEQGFNATGAVRMQQKLAVDSPAKQATEQPAGQDNSAAGGKQQRLGQKDGKDSKGAGKTPPWVDKTLAKAIENEKDDVNHLLAQEKQAGKKTEPKPHEQKRAEKEKKPARERTPEEQKRDEKRARMVSKFQHYAREYAPYLLMLLIVLAIFMGALYIIGSRFV